MHRTTARLLAAALALSGWTSARAAQQQYLPCPQGLFMCGEMLHPPKSLDYKVPVICDVNTLNEYKSKINSLRGKITGGVTDLRSVANTLQNLGNLYANYDPKEEYLKDTAQSIREGLLGQFMEPLKGDLVHAGQCVNEPQWYHADIRCWKISAECFNRTVIEWKMRRLGPLLEELQNDVTYHRTMLRDGLPTYISSGGANPFNRCANPFSPPPAPGRQHMTSAIDTVIQALVQIRINCRPS